MEDQTENKNKKIKRLKYAAAIAAGLVILYGITGYFVIPPIIKSYMPKYMAENFKLNISITEIKVNPFSLALTLRGFEIKDPDDEHLAGFEALYINFQLSSIFRRTFTFGDIRLTGPEGIVKVLPDGKLNVIFLLETFNASESENVQDSRLPPIFVKRLQIDQGRIKLSDLSRPTPYEVELYPIHLNLNDFSTHPDSDSPISFTATTGDGEVFHWEGRLAVNPLRAQGHFALSGLNARTLWKYARDLVRFEITDGWIDLTAAYEIDVGEKGFQAILENTNLKLHDLKISEKGGENTLISVPQLSVEGIKIDLLNRIAGINSIKSRDAKFLSWLSKDGTMLYLNLFSMENLEGQKGPVFQLLDEPGSDSKPWLLTVDEVSLTDYSVVYEDRKLAKPVRLTFQPINLTIKNLSNQKNSRHEFSLNLKDDMGGAVNISGVAGIDPVAADLTLQVSNAAIRKLQPYVDEVLKLDIVSGTADVNGRIRYTESGGKKAKLRYDGTYSIRDVEVRDKATKSVLTKLGSVAVKGIQFDLEPNRLNISEVVVDRPYANIVVEPDGSINVTNVVPAGGVDDAELSDSLLGRIVNTIKLKIKGPIPIDINTLRVENGTAQFKDRSLKPNAAMEVGDMTAMIKGLSSTQLKPADVQIEGKVGRHAPLNISGEFIPFGDKVYTDMKVSLKNFELTEVSPYSGKYAGYTLEKGKLSLSLEYTLEENVINGKNQILLQRLTLGQPTNSPDAVQLPIKLAVALLKDRNDNIDVDVEISGNIDDPQFNAGDMLAGTMIKFVNGVVSAPFKLLAGTVGSIGGAGKGLSQVAFDSGSETLHPEQAKKLDVIARALHERPALRLEIKGRADSRSDKIVLAEKALEEHLKRLRAQEMRAEGVTVPSDKSEIVLTDADLLRLVPRAYEESIGELPIASSSEGEGPEAIGELEKKYLENVDIDESKLRQLARRRARVIKDYLISNGKIDKEKVSLEREKIEETAEGKATSALLSLSAG